MPETALLLTPMHYLYLIGVIVILTVMILRKDTPAVCIGFLFLLGFVGLGTITGGIQVIFKSILYAATQFMEIIATIALVTALSKCLSDLGSDYLLMTPMRKVMKSPSVTWWLLGLTMLLFSFFLWPSPSVALVGAIMLPFACLLYTSTNWLDPVRLLNSVVLPLLGFPANAIFAAIS